MSAACKIIDRIVNRKNSIELRINEQNFVNTNLTTQKVTYL